MELKKRIERLEQCQPRGRTLAVMVDYEDREAAEARTRAETGYRGRYTTIINIHGGLPPGEPTTK